MCQFSKKLMVTMFLTKNASIVYKYIGQNEGNQ